LSESAKSGIVALRLEQQRDEEVAALIERVREGELTAGEDELVLRDGVLYKSFTPPPGKSARPGTRWRVVLPRARRQKALQQFHEDAGHFTAEKMHLLLREKFWWPSMSRDVGGVIGVYMHRAPDKRLAPPGSAKSAEVLNDFAMDFTVIHDSSQKATGIGQSEDVQHAPQT
jgi:hypothetical protein